MSSRRLSQTWQEKGKPAFIIGTLPSLHPRSDETNLQIIADPLVLLRFGTELQPLLLVYRDFSEYRADSDQKDLEP